MYNQVSVNTALSLPLKQKDISTLTKQRLPEYKISFSVPSNAFFLIKNFLNFWLCGGFSLLHGPF